MVHDKKNVSGLLKKKKKNNKKRLLKLNISK
jgi:hypothetical protein